MFDTLLTRFSEMGPRTNQDWLSLSNSNGSLPDLRKIPIQPFGGLSSWKSFEKLKTLATRTSRTLSRIHSKSDRCSVAQALDLKGSRCHSLNLFLWHSSAFPSWFALNPCPREAPMGKIMTFNRNDHDLSKDPLRPKEPLNNGNHTQERCLYAGLCFSHLVLLNEHVLQSSLRGIGLWNERSNNVTLFSLSFFLPGKPLPPCASVEA